MNMDHIKCVVVGDGWVGKTTMLSTFGSSETSYFLPTVCENFTKELEVDGVRCSLTLWDTAGQEDYVRLRALSYPNTDIFIMVFSIGSQDSLDNISEVWAPEVQHHCPDAKLLLVGNKVDLRKKKTTGEQPLTYGAGAAKFKEVKAVGYQECSALKNEGIQEVFEEAIRVVRKAQTSNELKKRRCILI